MYHGLMSNKFLNYRKGLDYSSVVVKKNCLLRDLIEWIACRAQWVNIQKKGSLGSTGLGTASHLIYT